MNSLAEARKRREVKRIELEAMNLKFSPEITFENMSMDEMDDLAALNIGETTYTFDFGDVTRTA